MAEVSIEASFATVLSQTSRLRLAYAGAAGALATLIQAGPADRPGGPWPGGPHEVAFYP